MKKFLFLLIIILISINVHAAQNANDLFKIEAIPLKSIYVFGEPIMIYGKITYLGKEPIKLPIYRSITMGIKESCDGPNPELTIPDMPPDWWSQSEVIKPGWSVEKEEYINWCILRPRIVKVGYVMSFHSPEGKVLPKDMWQGDIVSEWKQIEILKPEGVDAEAIYSILGPNPTWQKFHEWPTKYTNIILDKYPSSIYAGWILYRHRPDLPGTFVKNENAEKSILAAISRDSNELHKWWHIDMILTEQNKNREIDMKKMADEIEIFVNAHPEFLYSGYLSAKSGINFLGLGEFEKACLMFSQSLKMPWGITAKKQKDLEPYKNGTEWVLNILKEKGKCK